MGKVFLLGCCGPPAPLGKRLWRDQRGRRNRGDFKGLFSDSKTIVFPSPKVSNKTAFLGKKPERFDRRRPSPPPWPVNTRALLARSRAGSGLPVTSPPQSGTSGSRASDLLEPDFGTASQVRWAFVGTNPENRRPTSVLPVIQEQYEEWLRRAAKDVACTADSRTVFASLRR